MLIVGHVGWGNPHPTTLTPDEQYTHISLWSLLAAPLLIGCDLSALDDFTLSLLTNDEVIEVNQDPLGKQGICVAKDGDLRVYVKPLEDGSLAVGLFNLGAQNAEVTASWADLKISGRQRVRNLWTQKDIGTYEDSFRSSVASHGVVFLRLFPEE
jgi:alpha-galactosidase